MRQFFVFQIRQNTSMVSLPGVMWVMVLFLLVMVTCPRNVEAVLGIPEFLEIGKCVKVPLKKDFDPVKYSGLWFDIESVPNEYQHTKKCVTQKYDWTGDYMNVATRGLTTEDKKVRQGAVMRVETESDSQPNPAYMTVDAAGVPAAPYQIISSDYRTYSCVYSCLEYFGFRAEFFWIFGRTPTLPAEKIKLCHRTFANLGVDYKKMVPIVQGEPCPYNENLQQMLGESEQHLLKVLGPYVPTASLPNPIPVTTVATKTQDPLIVEEELKEIQDIVQEEKKIIQELESKIVRNPSPTLPKEAAKVSQNSEEIEAEGNSACTSSATVLLLLSVWVTTTLRHL